MLMMRFDIILKHVQTCHNAYDSIWYNSQTCRHSSETSKIWCDLIRFLNMSRHVIMLMIWYNSQTCLDLSETSKMTKYTKIDQMVQRSALKKSYSLDRFEQVERSKIAKWPKLAVLFSTVPRILILLMMSRSPYVLMRSDRPLFILDLGMFKNSKVNRVNQAQYQRQKRETFSA